MHNEIYYILLLCVSSHKCGTIYISAECIGQSEYVRPMLEYNSTVWSPVPIKISF